MASDAAPPDIFPHIRIIMGMVLSLGLARLLTGVARFIQHPGQSKPSAVHLGWAGAMLLLLVHFWWWEFRLTIIPQWTFELYFFLISYTILLYLLCALVFPDSIAEYAGYEDYFLSRRRWFFGLLAAAFVFDYLDTLFKGREYFELFGIEYELRTVGYVILCAIAMVTANRRFHLALVAGTVAYQVWWILRLFHTLD